MRRALIVLGLVLCIAAPADAARHATRHHAARHATHTRQHASAAAPTSSVTPSHAVIMDGASGIILSCQNCDEPMPPASMSKLMTVLLVADALRAHRITLDTRFHVSENAWRHGPTARESESNMFLEINSDVSVRDLLQGVVVVSANDACVTLAEGLAGSEQAFVQQMNVRAQQLGLHTAHFMNVTGLDEPGQVISAADLARLSRYITYNYPELYRFDREPSFTYNNHTQENRNPLLGAFPGADGVKTGHTDASGYGMIGSAVQNGQRRIIVFNGMNSMAARRELALSMMRSAFADYEVRQIAHAGQQVGEAQVWLGSRRTAPLVAAQPIYIAGPRASTSGASAHILYEGPLRPPIRRGQVVARLVVEGSGVAAQNYPLAAGRDIGGANWFAKAWTGLALTLSHGH